jgi:hypothetical protein
MGFSSAFKGLTVKVLVRYIEVTNCGRGRHKQLFRWRKIGDKSVAAQVHSANLTSRQFWTLWRGKLYRNSSESSPEAGVLLAVLKLWIFHVILEIQNGLFF